MSGCAGSYLFGTSAWDNFISNFSITASQEKELLRGGMKDAINNKMLSNKI